MGVYRSPLKHNQLLKDANRLFEQLPFYMQYDINIRDGLNVPDADGEYGEWVDIKEEDDD